MVICTDTNHNANTYKVELISEQVALENSASVIRNSLTQHDRA